MLILGPRKLLTSDGQASDAEFLPPLRGVIFGSTQPSWLFPILQSKVDLSDRQLTPMGLLITVGEISGCHVGGTGRNFHRYGWLVGSRRRTLSCTLVDADGRIGLRRSATRAAVGQRYGWRPSLERGSVFFRNSRVLSGDKLRGFGGGAPKSPYSRECRPNRSATLPSERCSTNSFVSTVVVTLGRRSSSIDRTLYAQCDSSPDRYQPSETQKFRSGPISPTEWYRQGPLLTSTQCAVRSEDVT
jgi:hypothetical protein